MALATLAEVKASLQIATADTSQDTALTAYLNQASARIETFCRRKFASATYTSILAGSGGPFLALPQYPVISITSVHLDNSAWWGDAASAWAAATLLAVGVDYALVHDQPDSAASGCGLLAKIDGVWDKPREYEPGRISGLINSGIGNIKVVYVAGFATIPDDLKGALFTLIASTRQAMKYGSPLASESYEDYSYSVAQAMGKALGGLPSDTLGVLRSYRKIAVG